MDRTRRAAKGFPNLTTASWLWGGDPESIAETIRVGINSAHPQSRTSQMMAFGRDQMLKKGEIDDVVTYVRSLSDPAVVKMCPRRKSRPARPFSPPIASPAMATTPRAKPSSVRLI